MDIGVSVKQKKLPKQKRDQLYKLFKALDENGDSKVSKYELKRAAKKADSELSVIAKDLEKALKEHIGEEYLTFAELEKLLAGKKIEIDFEEEMLRAKFNEFDLNRDGSITKAELKTALRRAGSEMPDDEADAMIEEADKNGDGVISFEEFKSVLLKE